MNKQIMNFAAHLQSAVAEMLDDNDVLSKRIEEHPTEFIAALACVVPAMVYANLTGDEKNFLEFNHLANQLCFQFMNESDE